MIDDAYLEAQTVGKTAALCEYGSDFERYLTSCKECIAFYSNSTNSNAAYDISGDFAAFIEFCDTASPTAASTSVANPTTSSFLPLTTWTLPYSTTATDGVIVTGIYTTALYPRPETAAFTTTAGGIILQWTVTTIITSFSSPDSQGTGTSTSPIPISTGASSPSTATSDPGATSTSKAWIAGPVVGSIAGVAILSLLLWLFIRRAKKNTLRYDEYMPPEMQGDTIMDHELHGEYVPSELMDKNHVGRNLEPSELMDKNHVGRNMEPSELP